jgi:hypothetical protein
VKLAVQLFTEILSGGSFSPGSVHLHDTPVSPTTKLVVETKKKAAFASSVVDNEAKGPNVSSPLFRIMSRGSKDPANSHEMPLELHGVPRSPLSFSSCASPEDLAPALYGLDPADLSLDNEVELISVAP